jgi:hypothetical protein
MTNHNNRQTQINKSEISALIFKSLPVVNWRSEGCDVKFRCLGGVVARGSGKLGSFGGVGRSIVARVPWLCSTWKHRYGSGGSVW